MESTLLGGVACGVGLLFGVVCLRLLVAFLNPRLESFFYGGFETIELDGRVFAFSLAASLISGVLLGLIPAWQASRHSVSEVLKGGARRSTVGVQGRYTRDILVVSQVGLAVTLLIGAGLMIRSLLATTGAGAPKREQGLGSSG